MRNLPAEKDAELDSLMSRCVALRQDANNLPDAIAKARAALRDSLRPAADETLEVELSKLAVACRPRERSDVSAELTLLVYVEELQSYPADIAIHVLRSWRRRSEWWPTTKELHDECSHLAERRFRFIKELDTISRPALRAPDEPTEAERREMADSLRSIAGLKRRFPIAAPKQVRTRQQQISALKRD